MAFLDPREIDKFGKIIALLGSNHEGERSAAAAMATSFLSARALDWLDLVEQLKQPPVIVHQMQRTAASWSHQDDASRCLDSGLPWKLHERQFLQQMAEQRRRPSEKQDAWLDGLLDRVTRFNRETACDF